jgi:hypothetical protein
MPTPKNDDRREQAADDPNPHMRLRNRLILFGLVAAPVIAAVVSPGTNPLYKA